jgi:hypothetical protein
MANIIRTVCPVGVYTLISDGNANVNFTPSFTGGRMAMGASQPPPNHPHYRTCRGIEMELGNLVSTKIWWKPNEVEQAIEATFS